MHPNDPITVAPAIAIATGAEVTLTGHPDTLARFVDHFGADIDHDYATRLHDRRAHCRAWSISAMDGRDDLLDALRRTSDASGIDLVIVSFATADTEPPEPIATSEGAGWSPTAAHPARSDDN
jgi:hypothetical protein